MMKRSAYLRIDDKIKLGNNGLRIRTYGKKQKFVFRLEINAVRVRVYSGAKGTTEIFRGTWETFVGKLQERADESSLNEHNDGK